MSNLGTFAIWIGQEPREKRIPAAAKIPKDPSGAILLPTFPSLKLRANYSLLTENNRSLPETYRNHRTHSESHWNKTYPTRNFKVHFVLHYVLEVQNTSKNSRAAENISPIPFY
jgi:hypothetical protein